MGSPFVIRADALEIIDRVGRHLDRWVRAPRPGL